MEQLTSDNPALKTSTPQWVCNDIEPGGDKVPYADVSQAITFAHSAPYGT